MVKSYTTPKGATARGLGGGKKKFPRPRRDGKPRSTRGVVTYGKDSPFLNSRGF